MNTHRRILILMHNWVGYLHGVQLGIAEYFLQRPEWIWSRLLPTPELLAGMPRGGFDGVIAYLEPAYLKQLQELNAPVVDISNWIDPAPFPRVLPDDAAVGTMAADYLMQRGLRQFGVIGPEMAAFSTLRAQAFLAAIERGGGVVQAFDPHAPGPRPEVELPPGIAPALADWLLKMPKPAGIFGTFDGSAADILETARHLRIRVPEQLCVLGVDDDELINRFTQPPLSSIALPTRKIGFEAARLLDALMNGQPAPAEPLRLAPVGVASRQSTNLLAIDDPDVLGALRFIRERVHERLTVRDLMRMVPVNRRYLERKFKQYVGRSPLQEIQRMRLETARQLLAETDLSMPTVARRSGLANSGRLASVFHQATGLTPTAYRRQHRRLEA